MTKRLNQIGRQPSFYIGAVMVTVVVLAAVLAPVIAPHGPNEMDITAMMAPPSHQHLLGTDNLGRDTLSRLIWGSRVSLLVGLLSVLLAGTIGTTLGLAAGYLGGVVNTLIMRVTDIVLSFPVILLALALVAALGASAQNVVLALGLTYWASYARLVRAATLGVRGEVFIDAAQAVGVSSARIMGRHIFPNILGPILVMASLGIGATIVAEASLDFLGLGVQPPTASWGAMTADGLHYLSQNADLSSFAGLAIMWTVLGFNLIGDGLAELMNPKTAKIRTANQSLIDPESPENKKETESAASVPSC
jgi:peptide/nickel transport system permease protein